MEKQIYAESGMGCTGPIDYGKWRKIRKKL